MFFADISIYLQSNRIESNNNQILFTKIIMKHLIKLSLLLLAILLPASATAYNFIVNGIYYKINGINAIVTYGTNKYSGDISIPSTVNYNGKTYSVTSIGERAFWFCDGMTKVTIPNSVTSIGGSAFRGCI